MTGYTYFWFSIAAVVFLAVVILVKEIQISRLEKYIKKHIDNK